MSEFIKIVEDKFKDRIDYETAKHLTVSGPFFKQFMNIRRVVIMPDYDDLAFDIIITAKNTNWPKMADGNLIMLIDGEKVTINPLKNWHNDYTESHERTKSDGRVVTYTDYYYKESYCYTLGKEVFEKICNCKSLSMRVYTGSGWFDITNTNAVVVFSKLFYNEVYDSSCYNDVVKNAMGSFTGLLSGNRKFDDISLDGSGAKSGCLGMIALLVTMTGAIIGGLCSMM